MNIFLTGDKQIGKTTIIKKVLKSVNLKIGGFFTTFAEKDGKSNLYMYEAGKEPIFDDEHIVAIKRNGICKSYPEKFDILGCTYIKNALLSKPDIFITDECGFLEKDSFSFQKALLDILSCNISVLGVIKKNYSGWLNKIAYHPSVEVIEVTKENRDIVAATIISHLLQIKKEG